jgi:EAL domain-containing protein (putative c-di-GMP-specific phosphodiesterase class I)
MKYTTQDFEIPVPDVFAPPVQSKQWMLEGRPNDGSSIQRVPLIRHPFTIGRNPENSLTLANSTVSGFHAELVLVDNDIFVRDLDSTNGTLLNGRPLQGIAGMFDGDILHFGNAMYTLCEKVEGTSATVTVATDTADDALGQIQFDKLINNPAVRPDFQPIVRLVDGQAIAYEALSRSQLVGLETPAKMFRVAAQRSLTSQLSEVCRFEAMRVASLLGYDKQYYLNTHPSELSTPELLKSLEHLREHFPRLPMILEVHESAVTSAGYLRELCDALQDLDIGLAYDDFGSGQARLMELAEVPPEVLKFDINIIQGLPTASAQRRSTVESLIKIAADLGVTPLAEGVETEDEAAACLDLGFELAQGYLFGRPERVTHWIPE